MNIFVKDLPAELKAVSKTCPRFSPGWIFSLSDFR